MTCCREAFLRLHPGLYTLACILRSRSFASISCSAALWLGMLLLHSSCEERTMTKEEFIALLQRVRDGDPQAAQDLVGDYGLWLRLRVRKQLTQPLRRIVDSTDIVQE